METRRFSEVLREAVAGETDSVEAILSRYMPLINKHSLVNGIIDEDKRQYIITHIVAKIPKFDPDSTK